MDPAGHGGPPLAGSRQIPSTSMNRIKYSQPESDTVEKIYNCVQTETGVSMEWMEKKRKNIEHFTFQELETMRIKVPDLISNPELFRIDLQEHRIYISQIGRGAY